MREKRENITKQQLELINYFHDLLYCIRTTLHVHFRRIEKNERAVSRKNERN